MDQLLSSFRADESYYLLTLDCGFSILDPIYEEFPDRCMNMGCREQAAVSVATGMAIEGLKPIIYSIASFILFRATEQLRMAALQHISLKVMGYGVGNRFKHLGACHTVTKEEGEWLCDSVGWAYYRANEAEEWLSDSIDPAFLEIP